MTLEKLAFPKPQRLKDKQALRKYHLSHPKCEVIGCRFRSAGAHHIKPRSLGGPDEATNLIALCMKHHTGPEGPHQLGHKEWFRRFAGRLTDEARSKFIRALRIEDES